MKANENGNGIMALIEIWQRLWRQWRSNESLEIMAS
jgi:hypothetical protein